MADIIFQDGPKRKRSRSASREREANSNVSDDEQNIVDEAAADDKPAPLRYAITSFGADFDIEGIVKRLERGQILIPSFERGDIWTIKEASRFIESLLLGLPVPGVFLAREETSNKFLVIDGQQRLKTLQFFYSGFFSPKEGETSQKVFKLYACASCRRARVSSTISVSTPSCVEARGDRQPGLAAAHHQHGGIAIRVGGGLPAQVDQLGPRKSRA